MGDTKKYYKEQRVAILDENKILKKKLNEMSGKYKELKEKKAEKTRFMDGHITINYP